MQVWQRRVRLQPVSVDREDVQLWDEPCVRPLQISALLVLVLTGQPDQELHAYRRLPVRLPERPPHRRRVPPRVFVGQQGQVQMAAIWAAPGGDRPRGGASSSQMG